MWIRKLTFATVVVLISEHRMKYMLAIPLAEVQLAPQELPATKSWPAFNTAQHQEVRARRKIANGR